MRYFLLLLFSLFATIATAQTYKLVIDGRLPPGTYAPSPSWGDGTTSVQGGSVNYQFRNWDRNDPNFNNVQFYEELSSRTFASLTLRTSYFPVPSGCTPPNPNFKNYLANELIPTPINGGGGFNYCSAYFSVDAIPEMTITGPTGDKCAGTTIDLANNQGFPDEAYTWNFRIRDPMGNPVSGGGMISFSFTTINPTGPGGSASFNMIDLLGPAVGNNIGNTVEFYLGAQGYVFSNLKSIVIDSCTPLLDNRYPENTSCSNAEDGAVEVSLQSGLDLSENESLLIEYNDVPLGFTIPLGNQFINSLTTSSNGPNTFVLHSLKPGDYEIQYQSYVDPDGPNGPDLPYPKGLGIPFTFEILTPSPVVIDNITNISKPFVFW